jgi:hypothetical protein
VPFIGKGGGGGGSGVVLRLGRGPLGRETMWQQRSAACQAGRVASARGAREEWVGENWGRTGGLGLAATPGHPGGRLTGVRRRRGQGAGKQGEEGGER